MVTTPEDLPDDIAALQAALLAERAKRVEGEARAARVEAELAVAKAKAADDEALIAHQQLQIAKLTRELYGQRSERSVQLLDQMALAFEELESSASEDEVAADQAVAKTTNVVAFTRKHPARQPFPEHLPRERVVEPGPTTCQCCGSPRLRKLGEDITETLETIPRQWKVIQHVREKFTCRDCERISQAPAPFHVLARGWAGPSLLAMILFEKFGQHQPLNRQAERYAREGVPLSLSTLADQVGGCCAVLAPLIRRIERHVFTAERLHSDDTVVPVLAKGKTDTGRCWVYVRDDRPFAGPAPPAAMFYYSRDRGGKHPHAHLAGYTGIFQADAYAGYNKLYEADRKPGPLVEAACWVHARRPFFIMADVTANARRQAQGNTTSVISPLALEAVRRIDALFDIERAINGHSTEQRRAVRQELSAPPGRRSGKLASGAAAQALAWQRSGQGDGLHAQALAGVRPLPRRRSDLPVEQRRRASTTWHCPGQKIMVVRGLRRGWAAGRSDVQPDRHRQDERHRPAGLAGRRPGPHRRPSGPEDRRVAAVELATALDTAKSGRLIMAAIAHVFTIGYVANLLGEDEDWLYELSTDLFPEDGCLWVYGVGEDGVPAFTKDGIENLRQTITDLRAAGRAPPEFKSDE